MKTKLRVARILGVIGVLASLLTLFGAAAAHPFDVVASGLDNPRGLAFGPEGALYVVEAGRGGDGPCNPFGEFGVLCFGRTGAVTRVWRGQQERIVTGLGSIAQPADGGFAFGPHDISFPDQAAEVVVGACGREPLAGCGELIRLQPEGTWQTIADLRAYEVANNPDGTPILGSNPFAVRGLPGERLVVDAAGNDLLRVAPDGEISTLAVFPQRLVDDPSASGTQILMDAVPTSVAVGPDGALYVSELTGFPYPVGGARIYRVVPGEAPQVYAEGFTNVIDIVFEGDGSLLVLELAKNSLLSGDPTGALIRLKPDGTREVIASEGLNMPTAVAISYDALLISNCGVCAGDGQVIRIALDEAD